jgi:hypothetical protein
MKLKTMHLNLKNITRIFIPVSILIALILVSCNGDDDNSIFSGIMREDIFTRQDTNQCGSTSFYMIFKYLEDYNFDGQLSSNPDCLAADLLNGTNEIFTVITDTTWVSTWLETSDDGISCNELYEKINLLSACYEDGGTPFYLTIDGSCDAIEYDPDNPSSEINEARREEFNYILQNYLMKEYPVILHLRRDYPYPGHWIVLTGFDSNNKVYYMNPIRDDTSPIIQSVDYQSFITKRWYVPTGLIWWYPNAYWDGTWIGFHH